MNTKQLARMLASHGRRGDTILAHINPQEAAELSAKYGHDINPVTGLPSFGFFGAIGGVFNDIKKAIGHETQYLNPVKGIERLGSLANNPSKFFKGEFSKPYNQTIGPIALDFIPGVGPYLGAAAAAAVAAQKNRHNGTSAQLGAGLSAGAQNYALANAAGSAYNYAAGALGGSAALGAGAAAGAGDAAYDLSGTAVPAGSLSADAGLAAAPAAAGAGSLAADAGLATGAGGAAALGGTTAAGTTAIGVDAIGGIPGVTSGVASQASSPGFYSAVKSLLLGSGGGGSSAGAGSAYDSSGSGGSGGNMFNALFGSGTGSSGSSGGGFDASNFGGGDGGGDATDGGGLSGTELQPGSLSADSGLNLNNQDAANAASNIGGFGGAGGKTAAASTPGGGLFGLSKSKTAQLGLSLLGIGQQQLQANQLQKQANALYGPELAASKQLLAQYNSGKLNAGDQVALQRYAAAQKAKVAQYYASAGLSNSSQATEAMAAIDQNVTLMNQQMIDNYLDEGSKASGVANTPFYEAAKLRAQSDNEIQKLLAQSVISIAGWG